MIPTMYDRAMQALYALALEPVAETTADGKSFGFRKGRSSLPKRRLRLSFPISLTRFSAEEKRGSKI